MPGVVGALGVLTLLAGLAAAAETGSIAGQVVGDPGEPLEGVTVSLSGTDLKTVTDADGSFVIDGVAAGTYDLTFTLGELGWSRRDVVVAAGAAVDLFEVRRPTVFTEELTVYAAARRRQRITEAPAAVTTVSGREIALKAASGQLPKLLEFTVGAQVTQSGLYDFNFNLRGFNQTHNRRVQTLIDGRAPSIPFLGSQEWEPLAFLADDIQQIELVRGPNAALYGRNAFNGILDITTKPPESSQGGSARISAGDLSTVSANLRWAGQVADATYLKVLVGRTESETFTRSRDQTVEYAGLPAEVVPLPEDEIEMTSVLIRLDTQLGQGPSLTVEGAYSDGGGETRLSPPGRTQVLSLTRRWARLEIEEARWNVLATYNSRVADDQVFLGAGQMIYLDSENLGLEVQGNWPLAGGRGRLVAGGYYSEETVDSASPAGPQTLLAQPVDVSTRALYGQLEYDLSDSLQLVVAGRFDDSDLHDSRISPKAALVWAIDPRHTLRLTYNEAFQSGNYGELFVSIPAAPPVDLSAVEAALAPLLGGVDLGLEFVPILVLGNPGLGVEEIRTLELGYSAILGDRAYLTADLFYNDIERFITDSLPGVNPAFPPYSAPAALPPEVADLVESVLAAIIPGLSNLPGGAPAFVLSFGNAGEVSTRGVELASTWEILDGLYLNANYAWLDFDIEQGLPGPGLSPNAPEHSVSLALSYSGSRWSLSASGRWVDEHLWVSGVFAGTVPSYSVFDLNASRDLAPGWQLGVVVQNLFDEEHWELFGGDVLGRRMLGSVRYSW